MTLDMHTLTQNTVSLTWTEYKDNKWLGYRFLFS